MSTEGIVVRFAIAAARIGDVHVEQVQFVVAGGALAVLVDQQGTGMWLGTGLAVRRQGNGAGDYPQAQVAGGLLQPGQDRPLVFGLGTAERRQVAAAHGGEVFRQHGKARTGLGGLLQQAAGGGQVGQDIVLADHLDYGEGHGNFRPVDTCILPQVTQRGF